MGMARDRTKRSASRAVAPLTDANRTRFGIAIPHPPAPGDVVLPVVGMRARELVDLTSIFFDLQVAHMAAHQAAQPVVDAGELFARRASMEAAVIAYARCFAGGQGGHGRRPRPLDKFVAELEPPLRECHARVRYLRDKAIAHHVAAESSQVGTVAFSLSMMGQDATLRDIHVQLDTEIPDPRLMDTLEQLARTLCGRLGAHIDERRRSLFALATQNAPDLVRALKEGTAWQVPSPGDC